MAGQRIEPHPGFSGRKDTGSAVNRIPPGYHDMKDKSNLRIDEIIDSVYSDFFGDDVLTKMTKKSDKEKMNALLDEKLTSIKTGKTDAPQAEKNAGDKKADDKKADDKDTEKEKAEESVPPTDAPQAAAGSTPDKGEKKEPEKSAMEELDELIGLGTIKEDVKELISLVKMQKMREAKGMKTVPVSLQARRRSPAFWQGSTRKSAFSRRDSSLRSTAPVSSPALSDRPRSRHRTRSRKPWAASSSSTRPTR